MKKCLKCGDELGVVAIEGKKKNLESRRFCLSCAPYGKFKKDAGCHFDVDKPSQINKTCKKHGEQIHFLDSRGEDSRRVYRCVVCRRERTNLNRKKKKSDLVKLFGGKCELCGYEKCEEVLSFHHVSPEHKDFELSGKIHCSLAMLVREAKKCVLLCANCHGEVENGISVIPLRLAERCLK